MLTPSVSAGEINDSQSYETQHIAIKQKFQNELSEKLTTKAEKLKGTRQGQCVVAVRNFLGVGRDVISGMAKSTRTNSESPEIGSIIKLNMSRYGHVGVVLKVENNVITYYDSNGQWTQRAAIRTIGVGSSKISGYRIINP